jgi:hypothetical protein
MGRIAPRRKRKTTVLQDSAVITLASIANALRRTHLPGKFVCIRLIWAKGQFMGALAAIASRLEHVAPVGT